MKEKEIIINIERCMDDMNQEAECPDVGDLYSFKVCSTAMSVDASGNGESLVQPVRDGGGVSPDSGEKCRKERRMSMSAKKPPRPPRGLSLDAADQKLIKEISELLAIKRARIERMKALKKTKAAKGMSASTSSSGNLIAMVFTILFCIVIIFQGCHHPWGIFPRNSSVATAGIPISPKSDGATEGNIVAFGNSSTSSLLLVPESNNKAAGGEANH